MGIHDFMTMSPHISDAQDNRSAIQDVEIPPRLFQATGNVGSTRDRGDSITWEPAPALPSFSDERKLSILRRGTHGRINSDGGSDAQPSHRRTLSHISNSSVKSHTKEQPTQEHVSFDTSRPGFSWSTSDPFSTRRKSSVATNAKAAPPRGKSRLSGEIAPESRQRRGTAASYIRRTSIWQTYEQAKKRGVELQRSTFLQAGFEYTIYAIIILFIYLVLVGVPLWNGAVYWLWWVVANKFVLAGGSAITLGLALFYAFAPLLVLFEKNLPPLSTSDPFRVQPNVRDTALLIPCYKSAELIAATLEAALKIFPPSHIFVLANGNSPTPLDNTEEVCRPYAVNHVWSPIGSKIIAQFVGCYAAKAFKNVLLIDDDCALPENFPVVTDRLKGRVQCVGYTIKSVGPNSSKGNLCQQAQYLEYKLSGIQRTFASTIGSATFPHGAISLWDRSVLVKTFYEHPGFSVSEDWFFGHVARKIGCRIQMCSHVFVETETPRAVFFSSGGSRGGFGEMTIFQQRFKRWNFFFVNGMWYNMAYIFGSWRLGWWEIGAKIFVFQEVYETLLYLLTPFVLPISFYVRPGFCGILLGTTIGMYFINVVIFNELHLRRKNERLGWRLIYIYYLPYKIILTVINVASCYWSLWKYARYFAKRHPKVTEDEKAIEVVLRLEEEESPSGGYSGGRRMTVRTIASTSQASSLDEEATSPMDLHDTSVYDFAVTKPDVAHMKSQQSDLDSDKFSLEDDYVGLREQHFTRQRVPGIINIRARVL